MELMKIGKADFKIQVLKTHFETDIEDKSDVILEISHTHTIFKLSDNQEKFKTELLDNYPRIEMIKKS